MQGAVVYVNMDGGVEIEESVIKPDEIKTIFEVMLEDKEIPHDVQKSIRDYSDAVQSENERKKELEIAKERRIACQETLYRVIDNAGLMAVATGDMTYRCKTDLYANVKEEDAARLKEWLASVGAESLIVPRVNPKSFSAFIKERIENELPIPKFVSVFRKPSIGARKKSSQ